MSLSSRPLVTADAISCVLPAGRCLFEPFSLGLTAGQRLALVGANGSGKSTLLSMLAGHRAPTTGHVRHMGRVSYLAQSATPRAMGCVGDALGVQHIVTALARIESGDGTPDQLTRDLEIVDGHWTLPERLRVILDNVRLAHVALDTPVRSLSGGERARLHLAAQLLSEPDVLLMDEPTNDLDAPSRAAVCAVVSQWRGGLVVASHDRVLLGHVDRILELRGGSVRLYGGNYTLYREAVEQERLAAERELDSAAAALKKTQRTVVEARERKAKSDAKGRRARPTGSQPSLVLNAARERSQHTGARLQETARRVEHAARERVAEAEQRLDDHTALRIPVVPTGLPSGTTVCSLQDVSTGPAPDAPILTHVSFDVVGPERVALVGANGAGKSTLLHLLAGHRTPLHGHLYRGVPVTRVAYLDQQVALLGDGHTLIDAFRAYHTRWTDSAIRETLARFHFREGDVLRPVESLSGGERMRAALAIVLSGDEPARCLLLDEPTNHLDLDSIEQLEAALRAYDGALIVASHDDRFLQEISCVRTLEVSRWRHGSADAREP